MKNASEVLIDKIKAVLDSDLTPYRIAKEVGLSNATPVHKYIDGRSDVENMSLAVAMEFEKLYEEMINVKKLKNQRSLKDIEFNGIKLIHSSSGAGDLGDNLYKQNYVNEVKNFERTPNHYSVWWDLTDFFEAEQTDEGYDWKTPTIIYELTEHNVDYDTEDFFKKIEVEGIKTKILDKPKLWAPTAGSVIYSAIIVDEENDVYRAYWNLFNIFDPVKIELSVDNSKQCKQCLKPWMLNEAKCVNPNGHKYVSNK